MATSRNIHVRLDKRRLEQLIREEPGRSDDAIGALALEGERIVKMSFNTSPPGRRYRLPYKGRRWRIHIASKPGFPPNIDTGKLMNGIYVYKPGERQRAISTGDTEYAAPLEFGTRKMAARPFMRPMARQLEGLAPEVFDRFLEKP